jgi:nucleotide-binding universal stress UspA family protein
MDRGMNEPISSTPPFVVLVAVDATPQADGVIACAAALTRGRAGSVMHVVHVVAASHASTLAGQRGFLEDRVRAAQTASGANVVGHLREGEAWRAILQAAASIDADLIVLGTHDRHGVDRLIMGSVAEEVMRHAGCPVLVARAKAHHASQEPAIEPPCPDCITVQRATSGKALWCARHAQHHPHAHVHHAAPDAFGTPSSLTRA